ncbi:DegT/DnrJ/EryC1/StrS family aminotransferase [Ralstonia sp.]|uniref:DegT/DnrJ/EryC1/StrS family aminotransferase n=1 Tax=Ralstonia sp. TaxID=54061 RepID=UPI00257C472F|nr:DegT/DnrJ/EryC1/StrS family aminotransferase [Ralstonia sp.]MBA4281080.1 hypothetical protein [Ralstonia sp.]
MAAIPLFKPYYGAAAEQAVLDVLRSGQVASGPKVAAFEQALTAWTSRPHVVATSDMSSAMMLALIMCGVGPGDDVITPAFTCLSSAAPIANLGAVARWADVQADTGLLDPQALLRRITPRTRACVVYHAAGYPARTAEIAELCSQHGIALIEDCNSAFGARMKGSVLGQFGDACVYSFYPNRQLNATEGGAVAFSDAEKAAAAQRLRRFGIPAQGFRDAIGEINTQCDVPAIGWAASMNQLNAAVGLENLAGLDARLRATHDNAQMLASQLAQVDGIKVVAPQDGAEPAYWALLARVRHRDAVLKDLKARGVMASKLHHRIDTYSGFRSEAVNLPGTAAFMDAVIALPCGWWLSADDLRKVAAAVADSMQQASASRGA